MMFIPLLYCSLCHTCVDGSEVLWHMASCTWYKWWVNKISQVKLQWHVSDTQQFWWQFGRSLQISQGLCVFISVSSGINTDLHPEQLTAVLYQLRCSICCSQTSYLRSPFCCVSLIRHGRGLTHLHTWSPRSPDTNLLISLQCQNSSQSDSMLSMPDCSLSYFGINLCRSLSLSYFWCCWFLVLVVIVLYLCLETCPRLFPGLISSPRLFRLPPGLNPAPLDIFSLDSVLRPTFQKSVSLTINSQETVSISGTASGSLSPDTDIVSRPVQGNLKCFSRRQLDFLWRLKSRFFGSRTKGGPDA